MDGWTTEVAWSSSGVAVWEVDGIHLPAGHHLFKHAPALGDTLADAAVGSGLPDELRPDGSLGAQG